MERPDIDAILARAEAFPILETARHPDPDCSVRYVVPKGSFCPVADELCSTFSDLESNVKVCEFVASVRTDIPALCQYVRELEAEVETQRKKLMKLSYDEHDDGRDA